MNDLHIDSLQVLLNHPVLMSAVKEVFYGVLKENMPSITSEDDAVLGQRFRAYGEIRRMLDRAFSELETYRKPEKDRVEEVMHI